MMRIVPVPVNHSHLNVAEILEDYQKAKQPSLGEHSGFRSSSKTLYFFAGLKMLNQYVLFISLRVGQRGPQDNRRRIR